MGQYFNFSSSSNHVGDEATELFIARLQEIAAQAEGESFGKSAPYQPEVDLFRDVVAEMRAELPSFIQAAGWPSSMLEENKMNDLIVLMLKEYTRDARGRGSNASVKEALREA